MTVTEELELLRRENSQLKAEATKASTLSLKVSEKGGLSVYGLGRFPVTLYKEQWKKLISFVDTLKAFIRSDEAKPKADQRLKNKAYKAETAPKVEAPAGTQPEAVGF